MRQSEDAGDRQCVSVLHVTRTVKPLPGTSPSVVATCSGTDAGIFMKSMPGPPLHPKVSFHTPRPDLTAAGANSNNTCAFQGTEGHTVLNRQVGIHWIPWVQPNVNAAIIMHMLPLRSPIKPKRYCYLALSIADVCVIDYWGCSLQWRTLFIPNLLAVCCCGVGEAALHGK